MKYYRSQDALADINRHLRNKNLMLSARQRGPVAAVIERLGRVVAWIRARTLARNGFKLVVSEQIVEYPMVLRNLRPTDQTILDFGGYESLLPLQLSAVGYKVTVLDQRHYPFQHPNLTVVCQDLFASQLAVDGTFDLVVSISTVEHLGFGSYNDIRYEDADRHGIERLWRFVKPGGRLMVSVPAGRSAVHNGYRVYDPQRIAEIFPAEASVAWFCKQGREGVWTASDAATIAKISYDEPNEDMPLQAVAFIVCTKATDV